MDTLLQQLKKKGRVNIADFMAEVVPFYYQNNVAIGKDGDFTTAPEISQLFGETLAIWLANHCLSHAIDKFNIVEMGPGKGTLMRDILTSFLKFNSINNIINNVYLLEQSTKMRSTQAHTLSEFSNINWIDDLDDINLSSTTNIVIANEFFDCLPIRQFVHTKTSTKEIFIDFTGDAPKFALKPSDFIPPIKLKLNEVYEYSPQYQFYTNKIANLLTSNNSKALIIDYGYVKHSIKSTLQALKNHKYHNPLSDIGKADITALVNFSDLQKLFHQKKLLTKLELQGNFLKKYGIVERAQLLKSKFGHNLDTEMHRLTADDQMGALFKVLEVG